LKLFFDYLVIFIILVLQIITFLYHPGQYNTMQSKNITM